MGNKYRLLKELLPLFPEECNTFVDAFGGSGAVCGNYQGKEKTIYNEINPYIHNLYKMLLTEDCDTLISKITNNIDKFNLNKEGVNVKQNDESVKEVREYYANKYLDFRKWYNESNRDIVDLFTLTFYSFSNLIRFNSKGDFNMPYGNRCFCNKHKEQIKEWKDALKDKTIFSYNNDYKETFKELDLKEGDFAYFDPPYSSTTAIYNEKRAFGGWTKDNDLELFSLLEELDKKGVRWGLSNVFSIRDKTNEHLIQWCEEHNWKVYHLNLKYSSLGKGNAQNDEVYICNY